MHHECWDIKNCPVSHYMACPAYLSKSSCWNNHDGCLCKTMVTCEQCVIYRKHLAEAGQPTQP